jgi:hypothetical protein
MGGSLLHREQVRELGTEEEDQEGDLLGSDQVLQARYIANDIKRY